MSYKTYAEAKIANPDSEIVTTGKNWGGGAGLIGTFEALILDEFSDGDEDGCHVINNESWVICNPADYCSSVKEFLEAGFEFSVGDFWLDEDGMLGSIFLVNSRTSKHQNNDENRFILSASALNGGCKISAKAEQWTVYNNTLPLCELTDEQVGAIFRYGIEKGVIEVMDDNGKWCDNLSLVGWHTALAYRAKQKSERELFIEAAIGHGIKPETQSPKQIFGELFDSGKFKYIDNTQHFGENI